MILRVVEPALDFSDADIDTVVTKSGSHSSPPWLSLGAILSSDPNISRRLHQGYNHNIGECFSE